MHYKLKTQWTTNGSANSVSVGTTSMTMHARNASKLDLRMQYKYNRKRASSVVCTHRVLLVSFAHNASSQGLSRLGMWFRSLSWRVCAKYAVKRPKHKYVARARSLKLNNVRFV